MQKFSLAFRLMAIGIGAASILASSSSSAAETATSDEASILKWKDGKKAVFMLEFDDSCESHINNVIPELIKRGLVGTFYINPGNGPFLNKKNAWENEIPKTGMVYGNHTFKHKGAPSVDVLDDELARCNDVINQCFPDRKQPRLISFGPPGGVPWTISKEEKNLLLKKYNLIERPSFFGFPFHAKTKEELLKLVDNAIAKGDMGHNDAHGVGGDWLTTPMDIFLALLDKIEENKDILWITDPISYHQYQTERQAANLKVLAKQENQITLQLTCATDPVLYDLPLTLEMKTPPSWKAASISQGAHQITVPVTAGALRFAATPVTGPITLKPVSK